MRCCHSRIRLAIPSKSIYADGIVEDIITGLSRSKSLFVIARYSSFTYKGKAVDIKQVGRDLGVRHVLEGSERQAIAFRRQFARNYFIDFSAENNV